MAIFFASFLHPVFPASRVQHISGLHSKFALRPGGSMVDIQSAAAEIRRGIKKEDRKKPQGKNIMSTSATQGGHNKKVQYRFSLEYFRLEPREIVDTKLVLAS